MTLTDQQQEMERNMTEMQLRAATLANMYVDNDEREAAYCGALAAFQSYATELADLRRQLEEAKREAGERKASMMLATKAADAMAEKIGESRAQLRSAEAKARNEALEEAACIADKIGTGPIVPSMGSANGGIASKAIAQSIRSLLTPTNESKEAT